MSARTWTICSLTVCFALSVVGCAASSAPPIPYDTVPPTEAAVEPLPVSTPAPASPPTSADESADDVGGRWESATSNLVGLRSECGNVSYVSGRPDRPGLITAVALHGLWTSANAGEEWTELGQGEGSEAVTFRLTSVVYDPDAPQTYWITGLYNGFGVYRTDDDGTTFRRVGDLVSVDGISIDFADPERQTMLVVRHESRSVLRSVDGGAMFVDVSATLPAEGGQLTAAMVVDSTTFIAGMRDGPVPGIYRTTDAGETWVRVHPDAVVGQPFRAQDGNLYWLLDRGVGVATSSDGGATWTMLEGRGISPFSTSLVELPDGRFASIGGTNVIVSDDHGASWTQVGPGLPYDPDAMVYAPRDEAFVIWRLSCDLNSDNPVLENTIMRLDFRPPASTASTG